MAKKYNRPTTGRDKSRGLPPERDQGRPRHEEDVSRYTYDTDLWEPEQAARDMLCAGFQRHEVARKLREQFGLDIRESTKIMQAALK